MQIVAVNVEFYVNDDFPISLLFVYSNRIFLNPIKVDARNTSKHAMNFHEQLLHLMNNVR